MIEIKPDSKASMVNMKEASYVDNQVDSGISDRAPSQSAVAKELALKQDKILSSDDVKEGSTNLYFSEARANDIILRASVMCGEVSTKLKEKLDIGASTNDIKEGANQYFTEQRAKSAAVCDSVNPEIVNQAPSSAAVFGSLLYKQDVIKSSDDIKEGSVNKFLTPENMSAYINPVIASIEDIRSKAAVSPAVIPWVKETVQVSDGQIISAMAPAIDGLSTVIASLLSKIEEMEKKISELEKKKSVIINEMSGTPVTGSSGGVVFVSAIISDGQGGLSARYQSASLQDGLVKNLSELSEFKKIR